MFGIIEESKKFILLDSDHDKLRATALMLVKKEVYTEQMCIGDKCTEVERERFFPMFDENTVDEAIQEYTESDIEIAYTGDKYLQGYAPKPSNDEQSAKRAEAYAQEVDPITSHINRLRDEEQTEELVSEIEQLKAERSAKVQEIKEKFPYMENVEQEPQTQESTDASSQN